MGRKAINRLMPIAAPLIDLFKGRPRSNEPETEKQIPTLARASSLHDIRPGTAIADRAIFSPSKEKAADRRDLLQRVAALGQDPPLRGLEQPQEPTLYFDATMEVHKEDTDRIEVVREDTDSGEDIYLPSDDDTAGEDDRHLATRRVVQGATPPARSDEQPFTWLAARRAAAEERRAARKMGEELRRNPWIAKQKAVGGENLHRNPPIAPQKTVAIGGSTTNRRLQGGGRLPTPVPRTRARRLRARRGYPRWATAGTPPGSPSSRTSPRFDR